MENNFSNNIEHFFSRYESMNMGKISYDNRFYDKVGINQKRWGMLKRQEVPILITECKSLAEYLGIPLIDFITVDRDDTVPRFASIKPLFVLGVDDCVEKNSEITFGQPNALYDKCSHAMTLTFMNGVGGRQSVIEIGFDNKSLDSFARSVLSILAEET